MSAAKTVFMFSGQGSQYFQMGRALFDHDPIFRDWMLRLDRVMRGFSDHSVLDALYSERSRKSEIFDRTLLTHPAIFMVEYALAQSLMHAGIMPELTLGTSLGSFAAAAVAGLADVEECLVAAIRQADAFENCCGPGGMTAILGDPALYSESFLHTRGELVSINFSSHFVVSASRPQLEEIELELRRRNVSYQRLPVSFAFHSKWIDDAKERFEFLSRSIRYSRGSLPFMCCEQADILNELPENYFWRVARHPIRFRQSIARLEQAGSYRYIDVGPAGTLATFLKYELPPTSASKVHTILTPYGRDLENLAALKADFH